LVAAGLNNQPFNKPSYVFRADRMLAGEWREVFNSDAAIFRLHGQARKLDEDRLQLFLRDQIQSRTD